MCVRCEDYDKICYSSNDKDDELVCVKCLEWDMFDYCHELFFNVKRHSNEVCSRGFYLVREQMY